MNWLQLAGRLHPAVLHLPIGMFAALLMLEAIGLLRRRPLELGVRAPLAWLVALAAAASATSGWILADESGAASQALEWHRWLGISFAALCALGAAFSLSARTRKPYIVSVGLASIVIVPAGHFGGTLTHGENFLLEPFGETRATEAPPTPSPGDGAASESTGARPMAFDTTIRPIFEARCVSCHNQDKAKGGLRLHTLASLREGGDSGPTIIAGDAAASELIRRIRLPKDDDEAMPPPGKPQLTEEQIAAIERWVADGADEHGTASGPVGGAAEPAPAPVSDLRPRISVDPAVVEALRAALAHVEVIDPQTGMLWVDASTVAGLDDAQADRLLTPLAPAIAELSLAGTLVGDAAASTLARMINLRHLNLSRTRTTTAGLAKLRVLAGLESINLSGVHLGAVEGAPSAVESLEALPSLRRVTLWRTGLDDTALAPLRESRPELAIELGQGIAARPQETEPEPVIRPRPPLPSAAASLAPINSACPVSGKPVDAKYSIVHDGGVVAFCCEKCAQQFWENPAGFVVKPRE